MGILLSKKISSDLEAYPPVFGRYTSLSDEFTSRSANFTSQYKRLTASPAGSLTSGRSTGRVAESPLRKRLKYDNTSMDAFEKPKLYIPNKVSLKRPPIVRIIVTPKEVLTSVVKNEETEDQVMTTSTQKAKRRITLRMCIRRRPSYKKALQTPTKLPRSPDAYKIPEEPVEIEQESKVVNTVKTQAEICAMDTIIEPLSEDEHAELESVVRSEETFEQNIGTIFAEVEQHNEVGSEKQPDSTTFKQKSSLKICPCNSQRHSPYETLKPKSAEDLYTTEPSLIRVETLHEENYVITKNPEAPEESPLVMGKLLSELKQRIAEMDARKRRNTLPNLTRDAQDKRCGLQMRFLSDMSMEQAQIFGKLMVELKQRLAERNAKNKADNIKRLENSSMESMLRGLY